MGALSMGSKWGGDVVRGGGLGDGDGCIDDETNVGAGSPSRSADPDREAVDVFWGGVAYPDNEV